MKYLLDTNTCIRYLNGSSENIKHQFERHNYNEIALCSIVKAELFYGAFKSANPDKNLARINEFFRPFYSLAFEDNPSRIYGEIRFTLEKKGTPIGPYDLLIASIALSNQLIVVTHNIREFSRIDNLRIEDWEE